MLLHLVLFINHELSIDQSCFTRFGFVYSLSLGDILHYFMGVNICEQDYIYIYMSK